MLRLKQCLDDCRIKQQELVRASGWSKTQISLTLKTGILPVNNEKFRADVHAFVVGHPRISLWLNDHRLTPDDLLCDTATSPVESDCNIEQMILAIAGRAAICSGDNNIVNLARAALYLLEQIYVHAGVAGTAIAANTAEILRGDKPCR